MSAVTCGYGIGGPPPFAVIQAGGVGGVYGAGARYAIEGPLVPLVMLLSLIWRRVLLHDKLTGTRVVKVERILARGAGTLTH